MNWIITTLVAVLTGSLGLLVAGFTAAGCVSWYRISGFEGKSGYFMASIALLGSIAGFVLGLVVSRVVAAGATPGFFKAVGVSWGAVLLIGASSASICWLLADIPPKLQGRELTLEVEMKLPVNQTNRPTDPNGKASLTLGSVINHTQRKSEEGKLSVGEARLENGRWIIPGSVWVFTMRGLRSIDARIDGNSIGAFIIPLPARPGKKFENWSAWEPRPPSSRPPWPDTRPSYRFRVRRIEPPPPAPDPAIEEARKFAELTPDAPLDVWLSYSGPRASEDRIKAVMKVVDSRQTELADLIRSTNAAIREPALNAVPRLSAIAPEVYEAICEEAHHVSDGIRNFNKMKSDDPDFYNVQVQLRTRFSYWKRAWWTAQQQLRLDGRPPVQEIHDLALVRSKETSMDEIVINARAILDALKPPVAVAH